MSIVYAAAALADLDQIEDDLNRVGAHLVQLFHQRLGADLALREQFPLMSPEYEPPDPRFPGLRHFAVRRFRSYAVFYQPTDDGIRVARILHTARDLSIVFAPNAPTPPGS